MIENENLELYVGTKIVEAVKMTNRDYAIEKYGDEKLGNELKEGYKVKYENGYTSWSPMDVFEKSYNKLNIHDGLELETLKNDLLSSDYTIIEHDKPKFKAPNNYIIGTVNGEILTHIHFQEGGIKETGLNGIFMEDLIGIVLDRLECFQNSEFKCTENEEALKKLQESLMWLRKRTLNRQKRNVLGTHEL